MSTESLDIHGRLERSLNAIERVLDELQQHEDPYVRLAAIAEHRQHVMLAAKTLDLSLKAGALSDFQKAVVNALAREGIRVRTRILALLEKEANQSDPDP